ncbi:hypothetical protein PhCBS80983_g05262 [Powellomyces hirtus]|uniref:AB hydrolase-1 domain-containing protein n=1 Tax=Powellomyces hirtus TaxID=109895 RepID=A0A507DVC8_9FUNG|nr:hypothetical protein PhCBS80983_g05262 [Powellomyces hirtus]
MDVENTVLSPSSTTPRERRFTLPDGMELAAKEWGSPGGVPILALHGWLDNSNTWDNFLPLFLQNFPPNHLHIIALDFAGHGRSAHRHPQAEYQLFNHVKDVIAVTNLLGWQRFALLAHSMGAGVSFLLAATLPSRVSHLISVENLGPPPRDDARSAKALIEAATFHNTQFVNQAAGRPPRRRIYPTLEAAAVVRAAGSKRMPLSLDAATVLTERNSMHVDGGVQFTTDQRLKDPTPHGPTPSISRLLFTGITCPVLVILGEDGLFVPHPQEPGLPQPPNWDNGTPRLTVITLPGAHHLHLEHDTAPGTVEAACNWLKDHPLNIPAPRPRNAKAPVKAYKL